MVETTPVQRKRRYDVILAWAATAWTCLYAVYQLRLMMRHTSVFASLFEGLGAELEWPLPFLIANYRWLYPFLIGVLVVLVLAKELWIRDKRLSLIVTLVVVIVLQAGMTLLWDVFMRQMTSMFEKLAR
jgi:hypothetical protein